MLLQQSGAVARALALCQLVMIRASFDGLLASRIDGIVVDVADARIPFESRELVCKRRIARRQYGEIEIVRGWPYRSAGDARECRPPRALV